MHSTLDMRSLVPYAFKMIDIKYSCLIRLRVVAIPSFETMYLLLPLPVQSTMFTSVPVSPYLAKGLCDFEMFGSLLALRTCPTMCSTVMKSGLRRRVNSALILAGTAPGEHRIPSRIT